jgi:catechol 2,3-dioxygenase-like lactoylglutathione lyase family enzyme
MINGFHTIVYSTDADTTRAWFRDVLGWSWVDAGGGWLIFKTPPSELGVHPTSGDPSDPTSRLPLHSSSFMCDDIEATVAELRAKGVDVDDEIIEQDFGRITMLRVPAAGDMMLYQPRHPLAHALDG